MKQFLLLFFVCISAYSFSSDSTDPPAESDSTAFETEQLTDEEYEALWYAYADSIEQTLEYETGSVVIADGLATVNVPEGFKYLNGEDSEMILTEVWGNPPSEEGYESLGMLLPAEHTLLSDSSYTINITYIDDGFIKDKKAKNSITVSF